MSKFVLFCEKCNVGFTLSEGDKDAGISMETIQDIIDMHRHESHGQ